LSGATRLSEPATEPAAEDTSAALVATPVEGGVRKRLVKIVFGVAVLAFGIWFVASRWSDVSSALSTARPGWIVAAFVFAAVGQWTAAMGTRSALSAVAPTLPRLEVARLYFVSQLGKYVPGSVWPIVALARMCREHGIAWRRATMASLLALALSLVTGGVLGGVLVVAGVGRHADHLWWLLLLVPAGAALLHPSVISTVVRTLLRVTRRQAVSLDLSPHVLRGAVGWPSVSWLLLGLQCWALVVSLGGPVGGSLVGAVGGFALAYVAGTLFLPAPAGAGVREAVLGVALAGVATSGFGHSDIIVVVLLSRVLLAVLDFSQAGLVLGVVAHRSRRTQSSATGK
jgi:glycosyltransferase 2 family protein